MLVVDKDTFQQEVLDANGFVLVDYFGDGCEPCKALLPDIEALEEQYGEQVKFTKLNTSKARRLAIGQRVLGLPTVVLYKNGEKMEEVVKDDATKASIAAMIVKNI
ncbi:co-chaperone YbbN [Desulfuromonas acetoxidans]|uniref:Thioredoxin n=1 Tax=Desulfuromonas acetoxidans (strain DSM 684 / 11070) TaxID=281689 RepID=Q1JYY2_DESA6|nr:thioredoxin family protein [Desulfuromonas acetoxidans]EAT15512.1 thioredoxin-related [Desulfuromonas acetoxidans DSM 684]NVD25800.1 thiol reductase thioredoxin [Desulfuromonas acetoxidans]NVE17778.1 thiol reductase thioredoxin [Desulfuromonas acetoxidans]